MRVRPPRSIRLWSGVLFLGTGIAANAQTAPVKQGETEFPKGWRFPLELSQGPIARSGTYAGWLSIGAMRTVVPGRLRVGVVAAPALIGREAQAIGGVRIAWRARTLDVANMGSWGNVQVVGEHLWTTDGIGLAGGGFTVEAAELVLVGLKAYWSYDADNDRHPAWLQFSIGLNILKGKPAPENNDPFSNP